MARIFSYAKGVYSSLRAFSMVAAVAAATIISALASFSGQAKAQEVTPHGLNFVVEEETLDLTIPPNFYRETGLYRLARALDPRSEPEEEPTETVRTSVVVHNRGEELDYLRFSAATRDGAGRVRSDGEQDEGDDVTVGIVSPRDHGIGEFEKKRFELAFRVENPPEELTGELIVNAVTEEGEAGQIITEVVPGVLSLKISERVPPALGNDWRFNLLWIGCLLVSSLLVLSRYVATPLELKGWVGAGLEWDPKGSWASTFTTAGGLVAALLANGVLPEEGTTFLTNGEYSALTLFFSVLVLFGALFYNANRTHKATISSEDEETDQLQGRAWVFLVAMWLTMWAAFGQLATVFLILGEIYLDGDMTPPAIVVLALIFFMAGFFMARHAWETMGDALSEATRSAVGEAEPREGPPPSLPKVYMP